MEITKEQVKEFFNNNFIEDVCYDESEVFQCMQDFANHCINEYKESLKDSEYDCEYNGHEYFHGTCIRCGEDILEHLKNERTSYLD